VNGSEARLHCQSRFIYILSRGASDWTQHTTGGEERLLLRHLNSVLSIRRIMPLTVLFLINYNVNSKYLQVHWFIER
jgi:hypothetical protein